MNASLRDLATRAAAVPAPQLDASAVVEAAETRLRRRRIAAVTGVTAAVIVIVGTALLVTPDTRDAAPPPAGPDHKTRAPAVVETRPTQRLLTYGVGTTIHWGNRTIDVRQQAGLDEVLRDSGLAEPVRDSGLDDVDATDDGAVFITGPKLQRTAGGELGLSAGEGAVWFTNGSAPVRIGTTIGNSSRGFAIASSATGSTLVWSEGKGNERGQVVVYDTAQMREVARFGDESASPLAVYGDVVYWTPADAPCAVQADFGCLRTRWVMRFDKASGRQTRVDWADYEADRRTRPGLLTGPYDGDAHVRGDVDYDSIQFERRGDRLVGWSRGVEVPLTVANTGRRLRLRLPSDYRPSTGSFGLVQWLDADRVAVFGYFSGGSEVNDKGDILVCRLSTGACQLAIRGNHHTAYAVPMAP